jgi:hypothetical protein
MKSKHASSGLPRICVQGMKLLLMFFCYRGMHRQNALLEEIPPLLKGYL